MARDHLPALLDSLGYRDFPDALHRVGQPVPARHPYAAELNAILCDGDSDRVLGVYEVDGVPSVCLVGGQPNARPASFDRLRAQLWNQGLISLVLVVGKQDLQAWPVAPKASAAAVVPGAAVDRASPYSAYGVRSGALRAVHPDWFDPKVRVDRVLLRNLGLAVDALSRNTSADRRLDAQHLMAQVLFVSYLEDRQLIPAQFLRKHQLQTFDELLVERDRAGLTRLFEALKERFNGDFLSPTRSKLSWRTLENRDFDTIKHFRDREDLDSTQRSLWRYDFRFLPVELLSSIYESFLADRKKKDGAYYTPRHLANLAVDEAFRGVERPDQQVIWDGACGSGILLTTAFRRMLNIAQAEAGHALTLAERSKLLVNHVFGGDINEAACKIAAFSLYLCLLEDLPEPPRTILEGSIDCGASEGAMSIRDYLGEEFGIDFYYRHPRNWGRRAVYSIDEPSPTIRSTNRPVPPGYTRHPKDPVHHKHVRSLTPHERARIQTFGRDFQLAGTMSHLDVMIANAVPVELAKHVGSAILKFEEGRGMGQSDRTFKTWLLENCDYTQRTVGNVVSRLHRAARLLKMSKIDGDLLTLVHHLERNREFQELSSSVRSQLKQAVRLHLEFRHGRANGRSIKTDE